MLRLVLITLIDIVVIALWGYWANSTHIESMEAIGVILIVPTIIIVSGIVGLFLFEKNVWGKSLLINLFIAFGIFIGVFVYESWKQQNDSHLTFYFSNNGKIFNVILNLNKSKLENGLTYNIYEKLGEYGNAGTDLDGSYTTINDTIYLTSDKGKVMKIFGRTLFDHPQKGDSVALRKSL